MPIVSYCIVLYSIVYYCLLSGLPEKYTKISCCFFVMRFELTQETASLIQPRGCVQAAGTTALSITRLVSPGARAYRWRGSTPPAMPKVSASLATSIRYGSRPWLVSASKSLLVTLVRWRVTAGPKNRCQASCVRRAGERVMRTPLLSRTPASRVGL